MYNDVHMEVLELDGKRYLKAAAAARELGYTSDYVGQLCRSGKIDAHLVGRSWYVNEESIRSHKAGTHRSTQAKTKEALKEEIQERAKERHVAVKAAEAVSSAKHNFYAKLTPKKVKYDEDRSELIPILSEKERSHAAGTKIDVHIAGAEKLEVEKKTSSYALEATERPKIRFEGKIDVSKAEEEAAVVPEDSEKNQEDVGKAEEVAVEKEEVHPAKEGERVSANNQESEGRSDVVTRKKLVATDSGSREQSLPLRRKGIVAMTRGSGSDSGPQTHELTISAVRPRRRRSAQATFIYMTSSVAIAVVLVAGFLLVDQSVTSDTVAGETRYQYSLNLSNALNALEGIKSLK